VTKQRGRVFVVELRPTGGCADPVKALRHALKALRRRFALECLSIIEVKDSKEDHDDRQTFQA
jgi:hypothetical protein